MSKIATFLKGLLHRFGDETSGAVSVEAALVLPILTTWYAASFVFYDTFKSEAIATQAAYTVGDILSRQTEVDNDYIDGLGELVDVLTYSPSKPWIRVSSIEYTSDGYEVVWSHATQDHDALTTSFIRKNDIDDEYLPVIAEGDTVILTEVYVPYQPVFNVGIGARTWTPFVVTAPRFASKLANSDFE